MEVTQEMKDAIGKRVPVLDKGWIELVDFMPHPVSGITGDMAIVNAARVSFMGDSKGDIADKKLLEYLVKNLHVSPSEMTVLKFRIYAPVVTWWQWVRHRTFSFQSANAQSGRYTPFEEDDFYVPSEWRMQATSNKQASKGTVDEDVDKYLTSKLVNHYMSSFQLYQDALDHGVAREMARLFLPGFAVYYTWVVKVDASNLMNFLKLRMAREAQYEIRVYAEAIYENFFKVMLPWTAEAFEKYVLKPE